MPLKKQSHIKRHQQKLLLLFKFLLFLSKHTNYIQLQLALCKWKNTNESDEPLLPHPSSLYCCCNASSAMVWGNYFHSWNLCCLLSSLLVVVEGKMLRKVLHFYCLILCLVFLLCTSPFFLFKHFSLHHFFNHHWRSCSLAGFYVYAWNGHWMWLCPVGVMGSGVEAMVLSRFSSWNSR